MVMRANTPFSGTVTVLENRNLRIYMTTKATAAAKAPSRLEFATTFDTPSGVDDVAEAGEDETELVPAPVAVDAVSLEEEESSSSPSSPLPYSEMVPTPLFSMTLPLNPFAS